MQAIRNLLMLTVCMTALSCSTTQKPKQGAFETPEPEPEIAPLVEIYRGSIDQEITKCPITSAKAIQAGGRPIYRGVANFTIGGREKHMAFGLDGYGSFNIDITEGGSAPLFGLTLPTDQSRWTLYKGVERNGELYGSWGYIIPGHVDLKQPRLTINPRNSEANLPLAQLGLTPTGHISVLKFSGEAGELVLYVPERIQQKDGYNTQIRHTPGTIEDFDSLRRAPEKQ